MLLWAEFQLDFRLLIGIPLPFAAFTKFRSKTLSFCCILSSVIFCFSDRSSSWQWNSPRISVGIPIIILLKEPVGLFQKLYLNKYGQSLVLSLIWLINRIIDHCPGLLWKKGFNLNKFLMKNYASNIDPYSSSEFPQFTNSGFLTILRVS